MAERSRARGGLGWWRRASRRERASWILGGAGVVVVVLLFAFYLALEAALAPPPIDEDYPEPVVFSGTLDAVPLPQARAQSLGMLMEIYQALSEQAGVGDWRSNPVRRHVETSDLVCSTSEQDPAAEEVYNLAAAAPYADEEQALAIVERVAAPYGFRPGSGSSGYSDFVRDADQATITLYSKSRHREQTSLDVSTGCHRGSFLEDWPAGTEVVPGYLRGWGPDASPRVWPSQVPAVPTPSQGWPTPTHTPTPTRTPTPTTPPAGSSPAGGRPGPSPPPSSATRGQ